VKRNRSALAEQEAVKVLRGVGGDREWWWWNPTVFVGHLRVPLTTEEFAAMPPGEAVDDAGETGPERRRTP
jgi:hypothetical protein